MSVVIQTKANGKMMAKKPSRRKNPHQSQTDVTKSLFLPLAQYNSSEPLWIFCQSGSFGGQAHPKHHSSRIHTVLPTIRPEFIISNLRNKHAWLVFLSNEEKLCHTAVKLNMIALSLDRTLKLIMRFHLPFPISFMVIRHDSATGSVCSMSV